MLIVMVTVAVMVMVYRCLEVPKTTPVFEFLSGRH